MNGNERSARSWVLQAVRDLESAEKNLKIGVHEVCCFLCEQAVQKILKAFLILKGERGVLIHSTYSLAQRCAEYEPRFQSTYDACRCLDIFYTPSRYPDALGGSAPWQVFGEKEANEGLSAARSVFKTIVDLFPKDWLDSGSTGRDREAE
jgi:HEPN domain-containing protein